MYFSDARSNAAGGHQLHMPGHGGMALEHEVGGGHRSGKIGMGPIWTNFSNAGMRSVSLHAIEHSSVADRPRIAPSREGRGRRNAHMADPLARTPLVFVSSSITVHCFVFFACGAVVNRWIEVIMHLGEMFKVSTHLGPASALQRECTLYVTSKPLTRLSVGSTKFHVSQSSHLDFLEITIRIRLINTHCTVDDWWCSRRESRNEAGSTNLSILNIPSMSCVHNVTFAYCHNSKQMYIYVCVTSTERQNVAWPHRNSCIYVCKCTDIYIHKNA